MNLRGRIIYLQGQKKDPLVDHIEFPTGEKHIRIRNLRPGDEVTIVSNDPTGDLMKLGMAVSICRYAGVESVTLYMPFVPYARQDERYVEGDPLSIGVFAQFLNEMMLDQVIILDPHSKVAPALINNETVVPQYEIALGAVKYISDSLDSGIALALVAPDLGAAKKIKELQSRIIRRGGPRLPTIQCDKTRDPNTGRINGFKVLDGDPAGHHCLMVDDICDGGGTFLGLYEVLAEAGASVQSLCVTHGIFSKGTGIMYDKFDYIFASDSLPAQPGVITLSPGVKI